jgi:hypothetical protein
VSKAEPSTESSESQSPEAAASALPPKEKTTKGGGVWEWLWQTNTAASLRLEKGKISQRARTNASKAQVALDAAENLAQTKSADADQLSLVPAAELLKQAASFAILAILDQAGEEPEAGHPIVSKSDWQKVSQELGIENTEEFWDTWLSQPSAALWETPPTESRLAELMAVTSQLLRASQRVSTELDAIWFRRAYRLGMPLLALAIGIVSAVYSSHRRAVLAETAYPWTVSSSQGDGCTSPSQECSEVRYFFHTREEKEPWIEFDLEKERNVQSVKVANRNDCPYCPERAVPLAVEISSDHETWTEVGRKDQSFENWELTIARKARWVRFRSLKKTFLHFRQVRIRAE